MKNFLVLLLLSITTSRIDAFDYYVSPLGSDLNAGSEGSPFATLAGARNAIRTLKSTSGLPVGGVNVWLRAGYYNQSSTFALTSGDSGSAGSPIVYAAFPGEQVFITGAATLAPSGFTLVNSASPVWSRLDSSAQGNVYSVSLPAQGVTNYGTIKTGGFGLSVVSALELFCNDQPMTLGRWPNAGQPLARDASAPSTSEIVYSGSRPSRWTQAQDIWMHGLWNTTWADFHLDVASLNTSNSTVTFASAPQFGIGPNQPYYAYNLLEEIDEPGEYYVDRATGILYFWPTVPLASSTLQVSMLEGCLVQFNSTTYVSFRNLTMEDTRGPLMQINSGSNNCAVGCLFRNCGQYAVLVSGSNNGLDQCEVVDSGEDGVILTGGARSTLTAGNDFVTNCRIHRTGRINWAYHPAINFNGGCGNLAEYNLIDELPHEAILIEGNNHVIEYNDISRVCQLTCDAGAIYSGRDWGYRGTVISSNYIHHIQDSPEGSNTHGVYLDDLMSSAQVSGNIFYEISGAAIMCGGGRDNIMTNNIIAQCGIGHYNGDYARSSVNNTPGDPFNLLERLAASGIQYQSNPWASAYPACAAIPNSFTLIEQGLWRNPQGCIFSNNAGWANTSWMTESNLSGTGVFAVYAGIANNNSNQSAMFDEATSWDRSLRPAELTASVSGFTSIPFASIGPSIPNPSSVILAPPTPLLENVATTNLEIDLQWTDDGIHTEQQEMGFELQRQNLPDGSWQVVQTFGPDVDYATVTGLAASTNYSFRVRSFNAVGSVYSNAVTVATPAPAYVLGTSTQVQAGTPLTVLNDVHIKGTVAVSSATQQAGPSVPIFDVADRIQISFTTGSGLYEVGVRVRSGATNNPTYFWPAGYEFTLDGNPITLVGDSTTISPFDSGFGGCYWGIMFSSPMSFTAGTHNLQITAAEPWVVVNYLSITPLVPPQVTTFSQWQQAHFSADQLINAAISGWSAIAVSDGLSNLLKYAFGLDPWTAVAGNGVQVTLASGEPQLTFSKPAILTDVSYFVEVSNDLTTWTAVTQTTVGQNNGITTIQATESGTPQQFIRLRVTSSSWITSTNVLPTGVTNVVGVGNPLTAVTGLSILGTVGVSQDTVNNTQCVRLYDVGDAIEVSFASAAGNYVIGVRLRSGDAGGTMSYWQLSGYTFALDGNPIALTGSPGTVSSLDTFFGPTYWGTMLSAPIALGQGTHSIVITSARKWAVAVNVEAIPQ